MNEEGKMSKNKHYSSTPVQDSLNKGIEPVEVGTVKEVKTVEVKPVELSSEQNNCLESLSQIFKAANVIDKDSPVEVLLAAGDKIRNLVLTIDANVFDIGYIAMLKSRMTGTLIESNYHLSSELQKVLLPCTSPFDRTQLALLQVENIDHLNSLNAIMVKAQKVRVPLAFPEIKRLSSRESEYDALITESRDHGEDYGDLAKKQAEIVKSLMTCRSIRDNKVSASNIEPLVLR